MTERLYYHDGYLRAFRARIIGLSPDNRVAYLDQTAFYPTSGGQPCDRGLLGDVPVSDVIDEGERIAHVLAVPMIISGEVAGSLDWERRFDHMQQHSGQHLLSAVLFDLLSTETFSFHMGQETCTIDIARSHLDVSELRRVEERANAIVFENRSVIVSFHDAAEHLDLRKSIDRQGRIRVVTIADLDQSACGGTHVRTTGEIGPILIRDLDKIRGNIRVNFACGLRAVRRARADYEGLSRISRSFSASLDEAGALVAAQRERLEESEKIRKRLAAELAEQCGHGAYDQTQPGSDGIRRRQMRVTALGHDIRTEALSFTSRPGGLFLAIGENPPAILLAASEGSGIHAGERLKAALAQWGGRGGGNARLAQGSLPEAALLNRAVESILGQ